MSFLLHQSMLSERHCLDHKQISAALINQFKEISHKKLIAISNDLALYKNTLFIALVKFKQSEQEYIGFETKQDADDIIDLARSFNAKMSWYYIDNHLQYSFNQFIEKLKV